MRALLLLLLMACRGAGAADDGPPRVVSLHDVMTDIVLAVGAGERLVGVTEPLDAAPGRQRALRGVPRVGGLESIVAVRPDVVLGLGVVAEQDPALVASLRARGIEVRLSDPATLADLATLVERTGARLAAPGAAAVVAELRARTAALTVAPATPRRVFVYDCCDPPFTAGAHTVETELIARAGGTNVFAELDADWTSVAWEEVVARRPEVIVIHDYRWDGQGDAVDKRRALRAVPTLGALPVVVVPLGSVLGGLGSVDGLARLRAGLEAAP